MKHVVFFRLVDVGIDSQLRAKAESNTIRIGTPALVETNVVIIDEATLLEALQFVSACEHCAANASITFDYILDEITGCDPAVTNYLMTRTAQCPGCSGDVTETTKVVAG